MRNQYLVEEAIIGITPVLEALEQHVSAKYEKELSKLRKQNEALESQLLNQKENYSYQQLNKHFVETVNELNDQISEYKNKIQKLTLQLNGKTLGSTKQQQIKTKQQQSNILSYMHLSRYSSPELDNMMIKQEQDLDLHQVPSSSPPILNGERLSPTQYSSSETGTEPAIAVLQSSHDKSPDDEENVYEDVQPPLPQLQGNSYSIFHNNFDIDFDDDDEEEEEEVHEGNNQGILLISEDSPLSQKKRKIIEDSQKDYEELIPRQKKRVPLSDITNITTNNSNIKPKIKDNENKLNFAKSNKIINLSRNFNKNRDWIIEDFQPNPILLHDQEGLYTRNRFQQHTSNNINSDRCKCANCIKFFNSSGQPMLLSKTDRLNGIISKIHHRHGGGNLFNLSIDAPGLNKSEFPNTQESQEFKLKLKKINRMKLLIRLVNSVELQVDNNKNVKQQCGLYVFRDEELNQCIKSGDFVVDDWVYEELEDFLNDREKGII